VEAFIHDILGPYLASHCVGLSDLECTFFYTLATVKAVDDHAGVQLPWNPIRLWGLFFGNGLVYHNIHHQVWGLKVSYHYSYSTAGA
jgi:sphinganine C4-monooxygenase